MGTLQIPSSPSPKFTLRVVKVFPESPGMKAGLEPFLDFIIGLTTFENERSFLFAKSNPLALTDFYRIVAENANKEIGLRVFNVYSQKERKISIVPNREWEKADSFLGILVRMEAMDTALERTFKVLEVLKDSPAEKRGLIAGEDFILGLTYNLYKDAEEFRNVIEVEGQENEACVFNERRREVRHLLLKVDPNWGGKGLLGCEFGFGVRNQLKPGLENVDSSNRVELVSEINEREETKIMEKGGNSKGQNLKKSLESDKKFKIPPKNPFTYMKKASFEKSAFEKSSREKQIFDRAEKDFIEIEFAGVGRYDLPPSSSNEIAMAFEARIKNTDNSETKSNNSSFFLGNVLEVDKSIDRSETEEINNTSCKSKPTIKRDYSFFSRKLNRDYIIRSDELFFLDFRISENFV